MFTIYDLPFELFSVIVLAMVPASIILYFRYTKIHPGLPTNKAFLFMPPLFIAFFLKRYVQEKNIIGLFYDLTNIFLIVSGVAFFVAFVITQYQSYKYGYADVERLKKLKPLYIVALVMVALCAILIILTKLDENNMLP